MPLRLDLGTPIPSTVADGDLLGSPLSLVMPLPSSALGSGGDLFIDSIKQSQTEWCWATVMEMVFRKNGDFTTTPCKLANALQELNGCCDSPSSGLCNKPCPIISIEAQWNRNGYSATPSNPQKHLSFAAIQYDIDAGRVVEAGIRWSGNGGHAVLITGYSQDAGLNFVIVNDPADGSRGRVEYQSFVSDYSPAYGARGSWNYSWSGIKRG